MMRLPLVSRERYDEMKHDLSARVSSLEAELKEERRKLVDFIAKHSVGVAIYEPEPVMEHVAEVQPHETIETPEQRRRAEVKEAVEHVGTNARAMTEYISQKRARDYAAKRSNLPSDLVAMELKLDEALTEGREAASA